MAKRKMTDARRRSNAKYDASHVKYFSLKLNIGTDADIIEKLASVDSMQGYIKRLIRDDIAKEQ